MTQEDKELLLKDLCARLPYNDYKVQIKDEEDDIPQISKLVPSCVNDIKYCVIASIKPYLRPLSSMTEEEYEELKYVEPYYDLAPFELIGDWGPNVEVLDWLNEHHFDYRGLIEKGLALEAPEGMY
jgi:hypothetical protein